MKTKKFIYKSMLLLLSLGIVSCSDDFLDVNDNPNNPPISQPSLALPVAQQNFADLNATTMTYLGQFMVYNWSTPSNWSANQDLIRYNVTSNFYGSIFQSSYVGIFKDLTYIENYEDPDGLVDYSAYDAIAETIKGFQYQYLVDLYGDVPYTEANLRADNPTPAYDDAEFVYKAVIDSLTQAAINAQDLPDNAQNPGSQDIIFGGDMEAWAQFANTIKLRMLIRMSGTGQDDYIREQIDLIDANGAGYIEETVAANPGYSDNTAQQNPFYGYVGWGPNENTLDRRTFTVATDYTLEFLAEKEDPRLTRLYSEAPNGGYAGAPQTTELPGEGFTTSDLSSVGPGLLESSEQDQPIMLLSEALFLQAEAKVRGYIDGGEEGAEQDYYDAIEASFEFLGVENETPAEGEEEVDAFEAYISQNEENVNWDASPDKIEAIITQKWIALNGTSSIESWIELTRTGYPEGLPIPEESDGTRPVRLLYPQSELARNTENVPSQTAQDAFTNDPFWR